MKKVKTFLILIVLCLLCGCQNTNSVPTIEKVGEVVVLQDNLLYVSPSDKLGSYDFELDDKSLIEGLINFTIENPNTIVGYMGRSMVRKNNQLKMYYRENGAANISTPSAQVYLIGWGGIYYPAGSLHENVFSEEGIHRIVPGRGSDIWFWAAALAHNTHQKCLGLPKKYNLGIPIPQNKKTEPKDTPGLEVMEQRFQDTIDFFNIREKLNSTLPNTNID